MNMRNKTILIVDDVADEITITRAILEKNGFTVADAGNWCDAITAVEKGGVDLIILDLKMPEMNGIKLLKLIRENNTCAELPIIIYTSMNDIRGTDNILKGSNAFVKKSSETQELLEKIEEMFSAL
jgi:CheY-like chemotaxis protein